MFEFLNAPIACAIVIIIMILIVELNIKLRKQDVEEWEVHYASED